MMSDAHMHALNKLDTGYTNKPSIAQVAYMYRDLGVKLHFVATLLCCSAPTTQSLQPP